MLSNIEMALPALMEKDESECSSDDTDGVTNSADTCASGPSSDSPEALVKRDNFRVNLFRLLIVTIQLAAAVTTSFLVYKGVSSSNQTKFKTSYEAVAERIVDATHTDFLLKLTTARSLSAGVAAVMQGSSPLNTTLDRVVWEELSIAARLTLNSPMVSWSPLIRSDSDRLVFEEYARSKTFTYGPFPPCFVCYDPAPGYLNPEKIVDVPGVGPMSCGLAELLGRQGIVPPSVCETSPEGLASLGCVCGDLPEGTPVPTNVIEKPDFVYSSNVNLPAPYGTPPYLPTWQTATFGEVPPLMFDQLADPVRRSAVEELIATGIATVSGMTATGPNDASFYLMYPLTQMNEVVGIISLEMAWSTFSSGVFPPKADLVDLVVENTCGDTFTFKFDTVEGILVLAGTTDVHDSRFNDYGVSTTYEQYLAGLRTGSPIPLPPDYNPKCGYRYTVYPTVDFEDEYLTNEPLLYAILAAGIFCFTAMIFAGYDVIVRVRQRKIMLSAIRTNTIVSALFPENVRSRMYQHGKGAQLPGASSGKNTMEEDNSPPIADLYPSATIVVIDISGFTSWSSERSPEQVFLLLETIFGAFDRVATSCGVFKIETVGDSYVAVSGVPKPRFQHAVAMVRFVDKCLVEMLRVCQNLETVLGPGTSDLRARVGLHSGPVTAGVLRGDKARFQLFGDTINMASRMESTGYPHRIHVSNATADLLVKARKGHWLHEREDEVLVKGKTTMKTFWVKPQKASRSMSYASNNTSGSESSNRPFDYVAGIELAKSEGDINLIKKYKAEEITRLVRWNVEVLFRQLQQVFERQDPAVPVANPATLLAAEKALLERAAKHTPMDEMSLVVEMPKFRTKTTKRTMENPQQVKDQLFIFVSEISDLYRDVPFHNFQHASHVMASIEKLMSRIVRPGDVDSSSRQLHTSTYGISSDPLLCFALFFSALIHDVDHTGLTNGELNAQSCETSEYYSGKSVAEQNSIDIAWTLLMDDRFKLLRRSIYSNAAGLRRFRQLLVNAVLATDIADKNLKSLRESRWNETFAKTFSEGKQGQPETCDRRASVIFEYIIQASDICHTMQHWHTYQKFNSRLFEERYLAFMAGHLEKDPSLGWYGGEIWFFDNYIIPLAKKLDKCGVFGVTYSEFGTYAFANRSEWEQKGKDIVEELKESCLQKFKSSEEEDELVDEEASFPQGNFDAGMVASRPALAA